MSEQKAPARPRQVTTAAVMAIVFDVVLLASLFDTLARLRTPETRAAFDDVLGSPPGNGLGLTTAQLVEVLQVLVFVSGALAAVALVFAVFVLQRHRAARIGYTVAAGLMLLTVPAAGLLPVFVALAAVPMWSRPARDWYAGRAPVPAGADARTVALLSQQGPPPAPAPGGQPPPLYGQPPYPPADQSYGQPPAAPSPYGQPAAAQSPFGQPPGFPSPYAPPTGQPAYPAPGYGAYAPAPQLRNPDRRPVTVTIAAVLTWIGAGVTAALMLAFVAILAFGGDAFVNQFQETAGASNVSLSANQAMALGWSVAAVFLVWSIAAIVLAVLAFRRSNGARIGLVVSAAMTALLSLISITSGISAITLLMAIATVVLLFTGGANPWYSRRSGHGGLPPGQGPWGQQTAPPYPYQPPAERTKPW